jgi:hypothetical protein
VGQDEEVLPGEEQGRGIWKDLRAIDIRAEEKQDTARTEADVLRIMEYAITGEMPVEVTCGPRKQTFREYFGEWANGESTQRRPGKAARAAFPAMLSFHI